MPFIIAVSFYSVQRISTRTKKTSVACLETHNNSHLLKLLKRKMSDPDIHHPPPETHSPTAVALRSAAITIPHKTDDDNSESNEDGTGRQLFMIKTMLVSLNLFFI